MLRRLAKGLLRRALKHTPKVPNAGPSRRTPPTHRRDWSGSPTPEPAEEEEEEPDLEMTASDVLARAETGDAVVLLDIREPHELRQGHPEPALLIPMNTVPDHLGHLPNTGLLVVVCAAGVRSWSVTHWLREQGYDQAWSLAGGVGDWVAAGGGWRRGPLDLADLEIIQ